MAVRSVDEMVHRAVDRAESAVREALAAQGFGVPTETVMDDIVRSVAIAETTPSP